MKTLNYEIDLYFKRSYTIILSCWSVIVDAVSLILCGYLFVYNEIASYPVFICIYSILSISGLDLKFASDNGVI